jgi:phage shock protein C
MKRLYRSEKNRKIAGVVGGLAEYVNMDAGTTKHQIIYTIGTIPLVTSANTTVIMRKSDASILTYSARLYRSEKNRKIAGVVGGLAEYVNMDASLLRIITVVLALVTSGIVPIHL